MAGSGILKYLASIPVTRAFIAFPMAVLWLGFLGKFYAQEGFLKFLGVTHQIQGTAATAILYTLLGAELLIPILLLFSRTALFARWSMFALFFGFTFYSVNKLVFGETAPCDCFGALASLPPNWMVGINIASLACCWFALGFRHDFSAAFRNWQFSSKTIRPWERAAQVLAAFVILGFGLATASKALSPKGTPPTTVNLNPDVLTQGGRLIYGKPNANLTIVVFGDYQCPPCRAFQKDLNLLEENSVRVLWRHLPLTKIHEKALTAALWADAQPSYQEAHHHLMNQPLELPELKEENVPTDSPYLAQDLTTAQNLNLNSTPAVFAITPNSVYRIRSISDLRALSSTPQESTTKTTSNKEPYSS